MKVIISNLNRKYAMWLKTHLEKEHRKTKGKIKLGR